MSVDTHIKPSPRARKLYQEMVQRADNHPRTGIVLTMEQTLSLSVHRKSMGQTDHEEIHELEQEGWIKPSAEGGWLLD